MNRHLKASVRAQRLATALSTAAQAYPRGHHEGRAIRAAARHLRTASAHTGGPSRAADRALLLARKNLSDTSVDERVVDHVSEPVTGTAPTLRTLNLGSTQQEYVRRERWQHAQLLDIAPRFDDKDNEVATAAFVALIRLYRDRARLVEDALHGRTAQPTAVFRTTDGRRTGHHQPGFLTVFVGGRIIAELTVPLDITADDIWQLIANTQPTTEVPV